MEYRIHYDRRMPIEAYASEGPWDGPCSACHVLTDRLTVLEVGRRWTFKLRLCFTCRPQVVKALNPAQGEPLPKKGKTLKDWPNNHTEPTIILPVLPFDD